MRILGLDLGQKRIGVAISDPLGLTAQGLEIVPCENWESALTRIGEICSKFNVEKIVVGLPLRLNGTRGAAAASMDKFRERLHRTTGLPVVAIDERFTSKVAEQVLLEGDVRRKDRKAVRDMLAAVLILDTYLRMLETKRGSSSQGQ